MKKRRPKKDFYSTEKDWAKFKRMANAAHDLLKFASDIRRYLLAGGISEKSDVEFVLDAVNAVIRKAEGGK